MINMRFTETELRTEHLPPLGARAEEQSDATDADGSYYNRTLSDIMAEKEREVLQAVLRQCDGNKTETARRLGIATRSLYYKLERLGME
jgi:DNA-binding NtrC family response regulator